MSGIRRRLEQLEKLRRSKAQPVFMQFDDDLIDTPLGKLTLAQVAEHFPSALVITIDGVIENGDEGDEFEQEGDDTWV